MILAFIAPTPPHPVGGVATIFGFAGAMAARGHDVRLFHVGGYERLAETVEDISWFSFAKGIAHHFAPGDDADRAAFRAADVVFGYSTDGSMPEHTGLPAVFVQGYRMLDKRDELASYRAPCPKICVASWLVDVGLGQGVPAAELVHVPQGMDHHRFRVTRPIDDRPLQVSFCYNPHPKKGASLVLAVLEALKDEVPDLEAVAFGSLPPGEEIPTWVTYCMNPAPDELPRIYNRGSDLPLSQRRRGLRADERRGHGVRRGAGHDRQRRCAGLRHSRSHRAGLAARRSGSDGAQRSGASARRRQAGDPGKRRS